MGTTCYHCSLPIYKLLECELIIETLIIFISTNVHRPYVGPSRSICLAS